MITLKSTGSFQHTFDFLKRMQKRDVFYDIMEKYAQEGVRILSENTPYKTGKTASSWGYEIESSNDGYTITWTNSNINRNVNIAVILQYGHGTGWGGYVQGIDYINPATQEIFQKMTDEIWEEVTKV